MIPAHEILLGLPVAKREAAVRSATKELVALLESIHNAVGFPKEEGWNSMVCMDLESVRQHFLNPKKIRPEV